MDHKGSVTYQTTSDASEEGTGITTTATMAHADPTPAFSRHFIDFNKANNVSSLFDDNGAPKKGSKIALLISVGQGYYEGKDSATILQYLSKLKEQYPEIKVDIAVADTLQVHNALDPWQLSELADNEKNWLERKPTQRWQIKQVNQRVELPHTQPGLIHVYIEPQDHQHKIHYYGHLGSYSFIYKQGGGNEQESQFQGCVISKEPCAEPNLLQLLQPILNDVAIRAGQCWVDRHRAVMSPDLNVRYWQDCSACEQQHRDYINQLFQTDPIFRLLVLRKIAVYKRNRANISTEEKVFWKAVADEIDKAYKNGLPSLVSLRQKAADFFSSTMPMGPNKAITPEQLKLVMGILDQKEENYLSYIKEYILSETAVLMQAWAGQYTHIIYNQTDEPLFGYLWERAQLVNQAEVKPPPRWLYYDVQEDKLSVALQEQLSKLKIEGLQKVSYVAPDIQGKHSGDDNLKNVCFYRVNQKPHEAVPAGCCAVWRSASMHTIETLPGETSYPEEWQIQYGNTVEPLTCNEMLLSALKQKEWGPNVQKELRQAMRNSQKKFVRQQNDFLESLTVITDDILQNWFTTGACRHFLMQGTSGSGKSSWAQNFAKSCSNNKEFSFVLWIDARQIGINKFSIPQNEKSSLLHSLKYYLPEDLKKHARYYYARLQSELGLFIVDNYDPYAPSATHVHSLIEEVQQLPHARLVVTSKTEDIHLPFTHTVAMQGFNEAGISDYLTQCLPHKAIDLREQIKNKGLLPIAQQPMLLSILAYVAQNEDFHLEKLSLTQLFNALFEQSFTDTMHAISFKFLCPNTHPNKIYYLKDTKAKSFLSYKDNGDEKNDKKNKLWPADIQRGTAAIYVPADAQVITENTLTLELYCEQSKDGVWKFSLPVLPETAEYFNKLNSDIEQDNINKDPLNYFKCCANRLSKHIKHNKIPPILRQQLFTMMRHSLASAIRVNLAGDSATAIPNTGIDSIFLSKLRFLTRTDTGYTMHDTIRYYLMANQFSEQLDVVQATLHSISFSLDHDVLLWQFLLGLLAQKIDQINPSFDDVLKTLESLWEKSPQTGHSFYHLLLCQEEALSNVNAGVKERLKNKFDELNKRVLDEINDNTLVATKALCEACEAGTISIARTLLDLGADPYGPDGEDEISPLQCATMGNHLDIMKLLLKNGAYSSYTPSSNYLSPFFYVCAHGDINLIELFIENSGLNRPLTFLCDYDDDIRDRSAFMVASARKQIGVLQYLIEQFKKENVDPEKIKKLLRKKDVDNRTAIMCAALSGDTRVLEYLIEQLKAAGCSDMEINADLSAEDCHHMSALVYAIFNGNIDMLEYIIAKLKETGSNDEDINNLLFKQDNLGILSLMLAASLGHMAMLSYVLDQMLLAKISLEPTTCYNLLLVIVNGGHQDILKLILDAIITESKHDTQKNNVITLFTGFLPYAKGQVEQYIRAYIERLKLQVSGAVPEKSEPDATITMPPSSSSTASNSSLTTSTNALTNSSIGIFEPLPATTLNAAPAIPDTTTNNAATDSSSTFTQ